MAAPAASSAAVDAPCADPAVAHDSSAAATSPSRRTPSGTISLRTLRLTEKDALFGALRDRRIEHHAARRTAQIDAAVHLDVYRCPFPWKLDSDRAPRHGRFDPSFTVREAAAGGRVQPHIRVVRPDHLDVPERRGGVDQDPDSRLRQRYHDRGARR